MNGLRKSFKWPNYDISNWFPGHMYKGQQQIQKKIGEMDCILEIHDARIPFSGRNSLFLRHGLMRPHILVLNKLDLAEPDASDFLQTNPGVMGVQKVILTTIRPRLNVQQIISAVLEVIADHPRYSDCEGSCINLLTVGIPNVGKSSLINQLRSGQLHKKGRATSVGASPGVTKSVLEKIKISESPCIYMYDSPGILMPRIDNPEVALKLAACNTINQHLLGEELVADYILYWLNKHSQFRYVEHYGLSDPCDDIAAVLRAIASKFSKSLKRNVCGTYDTFPDFHFAAERFLQDFNKGYFGLVNLDSELTRHHITSRQQHTDSSLPRHPAAIG